jgi:hypothetical protein
VKYGAKVMIEFILIIFEIIQIQHYNCHKNPTPAVGKR